jgi:hypothetical protein
VRTEQTGGEGRANLAVRARADEAAEQQAAGLARGALALGARVLRAREPACKAIATQPRFGLRQFRHQQTFGLFVLADAVEVEDAGAPVAADELA